MSIALLRFLRSIVNFPISFAFYHVLMPSMDKYFFNVKHQKQKTEQKRVSVLKGLFGCHLRQTGYMHRGLMTAVMQVLCKPLGYCRESQPSSRQDKEGWTEEQCRGFTGKKKKDLNGILKTGFNGRNIEKSIIGTKISIQ